MREPRNEEGTAAGFVDVRDSSGEPWRFVPMDDDGKGGADFSLVQLVNGKPSCVLHGAMNKVSPSPPGLWRCITTAGPKVNGCRAACQEAVS